MDKAIRVGLVIGTVEDQVVPQQTRGEVATQVIGVVGTVRGRQFATSLARGCFCLQRDGTAKGTVAIGRRTHAALNLHAVQQGGIAVHIGPEHALVLGRVEGHAVDGHVDT